MSKYLLIIFLLLNIFYKINCGNALLNIKNSHKISKTFEINWLSFDKYSKFEEKETEFFLSFIKNENENNTINQKFNLNFQDKSFNKTVNNFYLTLPYDFILFYLI
jgi:hypothetical protein